MLPLAEALARQTHRQLELIARAHGLPFTRREPKAQGLATLTAALQAGAYAHAWQTCGSAEREALYALLRGGGALPLPLFTHHFGEIRPYRPWRQGFTPRHPWRNPISTAERLAHYAFIYSAEDMVYLVREAATLVEPLAPVPPLSLPLATRLPVHGGGRWTLLRDVAALVGMTAQLETPTVHGRWFSLAALRQINAALLLPEPLDQCHSELQTGRLRWLHYLAQVAGLIEGQADRFRPCLAAWEWLSAPPRWQWDCLMQAVERDLSSPERLWDLFRFPALDGFSWLVLRHTLDELSPAASYRVKDVLQQLQPYLLPASRYELARTLQTCCVWSGLVLLTQGHLYVHAWDSATPPPTLPLPAPLETGTGWRIPLPPFPALVDLSRVLHFARGEQQALWLDAAALQRAVRQGWSSDMILSWLTRLNPAVPTPRLQQQLEHWEQQTRQILIQPQWVLSTADTTTLAHLRADPRLREHFTPQGSAQHVVLRADTLNQLLSRLARRQYTPTVWGRTDPPPTELTPALAEYLLFAVRCCQQLAHHLDTAVHLPNALTAWLTTQVKQPTGVEAQVQQFVATVQRQLAATQPATPAVYQTERSMRQLLEQAQLQGIPLQMEYRSPAAQENSRWEIRVREIHESNAVTYVEADCPLLGASRTFRLDRILRLWEVEARGKIPPISASA